MEMWSPIFTPETQLGSAFFFSFSSLEWFQNHNFSGDDASIQNVCHTSATLYQPEQQTIRLLATDSVNWNRRWLT